MCIRLDHTDFAQQITEVDSCVGSTDFAHGSCTLHSTDSRAICDKRAPVYRNSSRGSEFRAMIMGDREEELAEVGSWPANTAIWKQRSGTSQSLINPIAEV